MDNINKKRAEIQKSINLRPAYESAIDLSIYTEKLDGILLNSHGELLESAYDLLYDFIYERGNENYPMYEIVNHYLNL